jgi:hypothetical protein
VVVVVVVVGGAVTVVVVVGGVVVGGGVAAGLGEGTGVGVGVTGATGPGGIGAVGDGVIGLAVRTVTFTVLEVAFFFPRVATARIVSIPARVGLTATENRPFFSVVAAPTFDHFFFETCCSSRTSTRPVKPLTVPVNRTAVPA